MHYASSGVLWNIKQIKLIALKTIIYWLPEGILRWLIQTFWKVLRQSTVRTMAWHSWVVDFPTVREGSTLWQPRSSGVRLCQSRAAAAANRSRRRNESDLAWRKGANEKAAPRRPAATSDWGPRQLSGKCTGGGSVSTIGGRGVWLFYCCTEWCRAELVATLGLSGCCCCCCSVGGDLCSVSVVSVCLGVSGPKGLTRHQSLGELLFISFPQQCHDVFLLNCVSYLIL